ncbi:MAG: BACON domain-containing protein [Alistipes sp.]|nr:BACON domain-containing protein [Alistipes sp.]
MKLKNLFYLLLALPLAFAACEEPAPVDKPTPEAPKFTLTSDATMEFEAAGGEGTITFVYDFTDVQEAMVDIECAAEWVEVADKVQAYAASFTFTVAANDSEEAREAVVKATIGDLYFEVTVKQAGEEVQETPKTPVFELVSAETMEFGQDQALGTIEFKLENPVEGVEVVAKANAAWVSNVTVKENTIEFTVNANTGAAREAKITATYGMLEFKVTVKQAEYVAPAPVLEITSTLEAFAAEGGEGVLAYVLENAVEGVELQATADVEWITITSAADGVVAFTVAKNETSSQRGGNITLTYGEVSATAKVEQLFEGYDPNINYSTFTVIESWAELKQEGKQWNITFVEKVELMGECQTVISFYMDEANAQRVVDGTYSVANGGILVNSAAQNGFSSYRSNSSDATDITDATFDVTVDTENKVITVNGTFQAANNIITLNYTGEIRGMDLSDGSISTDLWTEWSSVKKNWQDASELLFTAVSTDGSLSICFDILHAKGADKVCPEGTFNVAPYLWEGDVLADSSYLTYNTIKTSFKSGYITVEHISGGYKFTFDITDTADRNFKGIIEGPIEGGVNPQ